MNVTRNTQLTVTTSLQLVAPRVTSPARKGISFRNSSTGSQVISLAFSDNEAAVANSGIVLSPGSMISDFTSEGYQCWQGNISAIANAAGAVLSIYEVSE